jgi:hypothetical protein
MFEDKTKDLDDPGMFALRKLAEIFWYKSRIIIFFMLAS